MSTNAKKIIAFTGGGTGGHIYPLIAVAEAMAKNSSESGVEFHYFGPAGSFRGDLMSAGMKLHPIAGSKLRRYFSLLNFIDFPKFFFAVFQAFFKMYWLMPNVLLSKGGPGALPVVLAAWFYRIPVVVHDSDSVPGLTTLLTSRMAKKVAVSFEEAKKYFRPEKTVLTGNPVRVELMGERLPVAEAKISLNFDPSFPLLLVLGGSQGSEHLNEFILLNLKSILGRAGILHQTGADNFEAAEKIARAALLDTPVATEIKARYSIMPYLDAKKMNAALSAADVVFARAGSGSIAEAAAFGKPMILVPLDGSARNHQRENAYAFASAGGGVVIEESNLNMGIFMSQLEKVLSTPAMAAASQAFGKPQAAENLALLVLETAS